MRIVFETGKQRELVKKEKESLNLNWKKLSERLDIKEGRLHAYYYEEAHMPAEIFGKFSLKREFENFIIERKEENWGKCLGGKNSSGKTKKDIRLPEECEDLAELIGIMLGDGNLTILKSYKVGCYQIKIVGDSRSDKTYLLNYVKPLIEKLFCIKVTPYKSPYQNALILTATSKILTSFLKDKGLIEGDKIRSQVTIPNWIKSNETFLKRCLRGLIDTDGSIFHMSNKDYNLMRISFTNYNKNLMNDTRNCFMNLGFSPSKVIKNRQFFISKQNEIHKYLKEIGFSNKKHQDKLWMFKAP